MTDHDEGLPHLHLALEADGDGAHPAAWRHSGRPPGAVLTARALRDVVAAAEDAGFGLVTFADSPLPPAATPGAGPAGRVEAGTRAAHVSVLTDRIGLAPVLHVATTEPFHLATQLASLDHASRGRAGWVVGAAAGEADLATVGGTALPAGGLLRETADVIDTARALWDSWEDDAVVKDAATGRFLDSDKVHPIDFEGASFTVKGPLITPRPPQGQVVVLVPDALEADSRADVVLVSRPDPAAVTARAATARESGAPLVFAEVEVVLDAGTPAAERLAALDASAPWPESGRLRHVGSPEALAALLRELAGSVDGVRLHPAVLAVDLPVLTGHVLPELAAAGLWRAPRPGATLRDTLGLPRPANRFAAPATAHA
ncbi:LLM class flavin-dependent oxidoreductase [Streptomyces liangshanensis]|uniref:LLM class flavin-dependent oxidoreductase n=1 Tax=Streptomyces liangshanensis TaxID=2717324 RepID=A0A6G9H745_9ACTN|nr:LLM class flavin-dependent oxidoreductase [Streptomyces liangshanensis]QIQ06372.1 LLM class flavin-dependent oxidoreductase [Streptomyces liangshanensis]